MNVAFVFGLGSQICTQIFVTMLTHNAWAGLLAGLAVAWALASLRAAE